MPPININGSNLYAQLPPEQAGQAQQNSVFLPSLADKNAHDNHTVCHSKYQKFFSKDLKIIPRYNSGRWGGGGIRGIMSLIDEMIHYARNPMSPGESNEGLRQDMDRSQIKDFITDFKSECKDYLALNPHYANQVEKKLEELEKENERSFKSVKKQKLSSSSVLSYKFNLPKNGNWMDSAARGLNTETAKALKYANDNGYNIVEIANNNQAYIKKHHIPEWIIAAILGAGVLVRFAPALAL
jgi:hypothetical protein